MGLVAYHPNRAHYTAFVYRRGNTGWMEIDDLKKQVQYHKQVTHVVPRLLVYVKESVNKSVK